MAKPLPVNAIVVSAVCFVLLSCFHRALSKTLPKKQPDVRARYPPRGWNSYDSYSWTISEGEFLRNAEIVSQRLYAHGYEYVVVDYLWYRKRVKGAYTDSLGFDVIDEWGRMVPDPNRWPSSRGGKGFTEVAKKVHNMGLKFGIHVMRGISTQAVNANTLILDTTKGNAYIESGKLWRAKDIGLTDRACTWMPHGFMSVNTSLGAGRAFLKSLYQQYASWGVDFVKHDCVFGNDFNKEEITFVSDTINKLNRPILYSLSPGTDVTPAMAKDVSRLVNMYRITGDDWDLWGDVASHFDITRKLSNSNMIGAKGLRGKSWPDLDMLPLGWLTDPGSNEGPHRTSKLNLEEQQTQMTLWAMAKSPLMFGGDLTKLDNTTFNLITNPTILEINFFSTMNKEFPSITGRKVLSSENRHPPHHLRRQMNMSTLEKPVLRLTSCEDFKVKGWSVEAIDQDLEQVCWKDNSGSKYQAPFCLHKKKLLLTSGEDEIYKQKYQGKLHFLATDTMGLCLDASPRQKLSSDEFRGGLFSPCRQDANQMWELNLNGSLSNSYSSLCATVNTVKANAGPTGIRTWVATGRKGEIYVAFFNLNSERTVISANISDLAKFLGRGCLKQDSCNCREVWSGESRGRIKGILSTGVEAHGCALFVLE